MTDPKSHELEVPNAVVTYDVREPAAPSDKPTLLMFASPMEAAAFATLAGHFTDRTVVTYDPRGAGRSKRTDGTSLSTPDEHADDLHRIITELGTGPVDVFASSGGAVNALALVAKHSDQVRTVVAHEPPASQEVPDRENALAACVDIRRTYEASGFGPAMAKFIALVMHKGELPDDYTDQPGPDPAAFGLPTEDDGSRDDPLMGNIVNSNHYKHDFDALRAASTRVVLAVGVESEGELPARAATAVAERLGIEPTMFPSHHAGFTGEESGMAGEPEAFAVRLREVLDQN
ncbi:alpha/beta fold hydrolase [Stackebrandtia nassauensis]|uniref:Alpha/beta hydrolase fold protein n=1 Tax=Stackebrandtia nassauensis (strain DSM 44728 / CIP 108903 / NRRL B-16338 / NBRC 102104 / LLR-40K-21) TaxID=446470 RepID=D3Q7T4_STANL|nr:alpha/beta hydrolase [Stackebrandtia nassauensis]ADD44426.1 alpha/beta hydrolase fold protein [Stackebrandtia nassauensis DSM 44728]